MPRTDTARAEVADETIENRIDNMCVCCRAYGRDGWQSSLDADAGSGEPSALGEELKLVHPASTQKIRREPK